MKTVKMLPLAMAVVAALCPISVLAQDFTQEQIDAIVAKAVDKALADRQAKLMPPPIRKWTSLPTRKPPPLRRIWRFRSASSLAATPAMAPSSRRAIKFVGVDGSYNGASAIGRLGNEGNGGEFQITKAFKSSRRHLGHQRHVRSLERRS